MTIDELIELATEAREDLGGDAQVRAAYQPGYPRRPAQDVPQPARPAAGYHLRRHPDPAGEQPQTTRIRPRARRHPAQAPALRHRQSSRLNALRQWPALPGDPGHAHRTTDVSCGEA
jgi:hypothetical protein